MPTDEQVRDLLAAIRESLSPPWPADGDATAYQRLVAERAAWITGVLRPTVEGGALDVRADARFIREHASRPLPYEPEGGQS